MYVSTLVRNILGKYLKFNSVVTVLVFKCLSVCIFVCLCAVEEVPLVDDL